MKTFTRQLQHATLALAMALLVAACGGGDATPPPETQAPTVNVATNVLGTAGGDVTFTFTFSEDVGGSFTADDVTVDNGTKGALTRLDARQYTLVVTPSANATGNITVSIAAASYTDLNGNAGVAARATQPFSTLAPAVSIASSAAGTTATGSVTFTFSFSKDVGSSFTTDDVVVTGGTKGAFTKSTGTSATLVVAPPANATGTIVVSVAALTFADSGGVGNVDAASTQQAFDTTGAVVPPPVGTGTLLLSFDETPPAFTDMGAYGGALPSVEPGPAGGSGSALKILKPASPDTWGGVYFNVARIPFTADRKKITARVNATRAGAVIRLKVEVPGGAFVEVAGTATGAANTWSTVTWDFSAADVNSSYTLMAITPDVDRVTDGQSYFIDEITLVPAEPVTPPPSGGTVLLSFDETPPAFMGMGAYGGALPSVEAGPAGGSGNALKIFKPVSPDTWGGTFFNTARVPFTAERKKITARVNATRAGAVIRLKVEVPGGASVEVAGTATGAANTWGTVTWDFSAVNLSLSYTVMAITPDAERVTDGQSYFIDDITLAPADAVVPPTPPGTVFLSFDENPPAFSEMGAYGGAQPTVEAGPAGGSGNALKVLKPASPDTWGGVFFTTAKIPFTATAKTITAKVRSTRAGAVIRFKVEVPGGANVEVDGTPTGAANTWGTVSWNFSAADLAQSYKIMAITPDATRVTDGQIYYIDDIMVTEGGGAVPSQPVTIATLDEPSAALQGFEGCWDSTLVADPAGGANKVGRVVKPGSGVPFYCGSTVITVANGGFTPIPFTATATTVTVRLWSPDAGIPVRLKVEDIADATKSVETEAMTTAAGAWQTLTFDFAKQVAGTAALNLATTYNKASIFFDFGTVGSGKTYYFDDITFVTGTGSNLVLANFDERNFDNTQSQPSVLLGFGGAENSSLVGTSDGMPADGTKTGKSARVIKNPGEVWAGTSVQRKPNDAVPTIPFAAGATKMSVRVYSAYPGMRVHLKVEQSGRPDFNSEVDAYTTLANTWETLVFDFGPAGKHFIPNGPGPNDYDLNKPTSQLDVSKVFNKVNIFFDFGLGEAGYDAMPGTRTYYFDDVKFVGP